MAILNCIECVFVVFYRGFDTPNHVVRYRVRESNDNNNMNVKNGILHV